MVLRLIFTICFVLLNFCPLFADEPLSFDLGEILVAKDRETLAANPAITEVSSEDIEIKHSQSVVDALDFVSGVRLSIGLRNEPYVMLRGFDQDQLLVLLDGIPIASPYHGYVDLSQLPIESISKIKIIKGGSSVLYGANTLGGVINIVTRKSGEKPYLEIDNGISEHNTHYHILNYGMKKKDISFWFSGSYRQSDGYRLSDKFQARRNENGGYRNNSDYKKRGFSLKLGSEKIPDHDLSLTFNYIDNEKGVPPHVSNSSPKYWRFTQWQRWMVALADEFQVWENLSIKGRLYYDKYDNTLKSYDDNTYSTQNMGYAWTSIYDEYSLGSSIYFYLSSTDSHFLKGSINLKKDVHKEQDDCDQPWESYEINTYSLGLQDDYKVNDKLSLSLGASFDIFDQVRSEMGNKGDNIYSFSPLFIANYHLDPDTLIYASVSQKTRFPTMSQLFSATSGNPNLDEQTNINAEVGLRYDFDEVATVELSYFYNHVKDLIDRASKNDPFLNISKAIFEGMEASLQARFIKNLSSRLSYTYLNARDKDPSVIGRTEKELPYVPHHKLDIELKYTADFGLTFSLLGSYNGERYYYDSSNMQHSLGGYFVWNTKLSQKFLKYWEASLSIENLFDRNYQEEEGYPQAGRMVWFSIKGEF